MTTKERPILFSGSMVRAILDGRKTQTRRVVKPQQVGAWRIVHNDDGWAQKNAGDPPTYIPVACPYGQPGDRLWVRETWHPFGIGASPNWTSDRVLYRADNGGLQPFDGCASHPLAAPVAWVGSQSNAWRPSIFMPRWASRITLEVVSVRVERVQSISVEDVLAEGIQTAHMMESLTENFRLLWNTINAKRGYRWAANPWVWVVEFRRLGE